MKPDHAVVLFALFSSAIVQAVDGPRRIKSLKSKPGADDHELCKRRGGGGHGGGRGGRSKGANLGGRGRSSGGSGTPARGPQPSYVDGQYYGGGAKAPYKAGDESFSGIVPSVLLASALTFWPGLWLYGAYVYSYSNTYRYYNQTSGEEEDRNVLCACSIAAFCGCDDSNSTQLYSELIGNASYGALNKSIVDVAEVNGTTTILINGTLPNGTALPADGSAAAGTTIEVIGYWPAVVAVISTVIIA